jgi:hypothetical protein
VAADPSRRSFWSAAACWALGLSILGLIPAASAQTLAVDPAAVQKLKRMSEFLDSLQRFSVETQNTLEDLHQSGHRVDVDVTANVTVARPNRLRAMRTGGVMDQRLYYDGKTLTLFNPAEKVFATEAAPPTVEKTIDFARETIGILLPAADLLYRNAFPLLSQDLKLAVVVGKAVIGGVRCDHLLFSRPGADFQVWIAEGSKPWPHKYTVTDTSTPARLSITTLLSHWKVLPAVDDAMFRFVPPKGAQQIRFLSVEPARPAPVK